MPLATFGSASALIRCKCSICSHAAYGCSGQFTASIELGWLGIQDFTNPKWCISAKNTVHAGVRLSTRRADGARVAEKSVLAVMGAKIARGPENALNININLQSNLYSPNHGLGAI
jgi:hypothetical protein